MPTIKQLETFLRAVDYDFPVPLSHKQDLSAYAQKLAARATLCTVCEDDTIVSMVAGYTDHMPDGKAYIAIVATLPWARGKGYARRLVSEFISECAEKNIAAVHLYAVPENEPAMKMYLSMGFEMLCATDEQRPEDAHLIYYLNQ